MNYKVSYKRHLAKTISYRIVSTTIGFLGMWWATGSIKFGVAFSAIELIYKPIQYYIHERVWYKYIKFGLEEIIEKKKKTPAKIEKDFIQISDKSETSKNEPKKKVLNYSSNR